LTSFARRFLVRIPIDSTVSPLFAKGA
jgi:hypothetical protein